MRLFLSDLHLESETSPAFLTLSRLLKTERHRCRAIYLLGDLLEVWIGDDDDGPLSSALRNLFAETTAHCDLFVLRGNRDFLLGDAFARQTGCRLLADECLMDSSTLLAHGDSFCVDDAEYQQLRNTLRDQAWQQQVLAQPLSTRREMARSLREQSRQANANKADNIMDVNADELARVMSSVMATVLIHGHTHRPGVHRHPWGTRYVLGAWERCGWLVREQAGRMQLECFPLTNGE